MSIYLKRSLPKPWYHFTTQRVLSAQYTRWNYRQVWKRKTHTHNHTQKRGSHHLSYLAIPLHQPRLIGWKERRRGEEGVGRHYAYENVLKEVWFMYALDADSITGQWLKWDLSRNTGATWSDSVSLLAMRAAAGNYRRKGGRRGETERERERGCDIRERRNRGGIFTTWTHTPHPQG